MHMKALARHEIDHSLAIEPAEAVAHRGHADSEIVGETGGIDPGAGRPFPGHQLTLDRLIGRLEHMRGTHCPFLSAAANSDTASAWSGRSASIAPICAGSSSCS